MVSFRRLALPLLAICILIPMLSACNSHSDFEGEYEPLRGVDCRPLVDGRRELFASIWMGPDNGYIVKIYGANLISVSSQRLADGRLAFVFGATPGMRKVIFKPHGDNRLILDEISIDGQSKMRELLTEIGFGNDALCLQRTH